MVSMEQVRWGIIGAGQIACDRAIPAILAAKNARLVAVADVDTERLNLVKELVPSVECFRSHLELLAHDIDAVYIALPNELHHRFTLEAATYGKNVLCEKPVATNAREAREMIEACQLNGVKLMAAYMSRFGDVFQEAKRLIHSGRLGAIALVSANFSFDATRSYALGQRGSWRWSGKGGGPLLDTGIYLAFGIRELLERRFARVSANISTVVAKEMPIPDTVVAWFEMEDGIPGMLTTAYSHDCSSVIIHGRDGSLTLDSCFAQRPTGRLSCRAGHFRLEVDSDISKMNHFHNYQKEFEHFSQAILEGTSYRPAPQEFLDDMVFLDALAESAKSGKAQTIRYEPLSGSS